MPIDPPRDTAQNIRTAIEAVRSVEQAKANPGTLNKGLSYLWAPEAMEATVGGFMGLCAKLLERIGGDPLQTLAAIEAELPKK